MRKVFAWLCLMVAATVFAQEAPPWRRPAPEVQQLDVAAFSEVDGIVQALGDVQSVVVVLQGRVAYEYCKTPSR